MCFHFSFYDPDRPIRIWQDSNTGGQDREMPKMWQDIYVQHRELLVSELGAFLKLVWIDFLDTGHCSLLHILRRLIVSKKSNSSLLSLLDWHKSYLSVDRPYWCQGIEMFRLTSCITSISFMDESAGSCWYKKQAPEGFDKNLQGWDTQSSGVEVCIL